MKIFQKKLKSITESTKKAKKKERIGTKAQYLVRNSGKAGNITQILLVTTTRRENSVNLRERKRERFRVTERGERKWGMGLKSEFGGIRL
ncbi:hypothetical protein TIFTF001_000818 [Ficus carica]|uniref:Uncharacterized protein n=1 Tax=Ficus carica TaxID=3494 RepID=A0AA87YX66_FICCA|nr:hypothetical protein TIFTF001_000818 [Ficus carica]